MNDHPIIQQTERYGYGYPLETHLHHVPSYNACEGCQDYEAEIKVNGFKLCSVCAKSEGVEFL